MHNKDNAECMVILPLLLDAALADSTPGLAEPTTDFRPPITSGHP